VRVCVNEWAVHVCKGTGKIGDSPIRTFQTSRATVLRLRGGRGFFGVDPTTRYYEILGLRKLDLPDENAIKKAYHKKALKSPSLPSSCSHDDWRV